MAILTPVKLMEHIYDRKPFINNIHPEHHPDSMAYSQYWDGQEQKCIEGMWGLDSDGVNGGYRYMSGPLYFYINMWKILHVDEKNKSRSLINPHLRDVEWMFFYEWFMARGFSGFSDDDEFSCHLSLEDPEEFTDEELVNKYCLDENGKVLDFYRLNFFKEDGTRKTYCKPREYLHRTHDKPLGKPYYLNQASNFFCLGSRGFGKSFMSSALIAHEFLFDGHKYYDETYMYKPNTVEIFVGAAITDKSSDLLLKFKQGLATLPGQFGQGDSYVPSPLHKSVVGSLQPGNSKSKFRNQYEKKEGGTWVTKGTGSSITHGIFTSENPQAAVGGRYTFMLIEEVGLLGNVLSVHGANETCQVDGTIKFGSSLYIGCVCKDTEVFDGNGKLIKIQDITEKDSILANDGANGVISQNIELKNGRAKVPCYQLETNSGRILRCSFDHPILTRKRTTYLKLKPEYIETQFVRPKDAVAVPDIIDYWGEESLFDAYLVGLLIADGTYGKDQNCTLSNADPDIWKYVDSRYETRNKPTTTCRKSRILGILPELDNLGIRGQVSVHKDLPNKVYDCTKKEACALIAGLYDGDGCFYISKDKKEFAIKYTSVSEKLVHNLLYLLQKLGVHGKIRKEEPRKTKVANGKHCTYNLYVKDKVSVDRFCENISLVSTRKQSKLNEIKEASSKKKSKYSIKNNIRYEKVVKCFAIGKHEVYNLKALSNNCYIANGIQTHNTGGNMEKIIEAKMIFKDPKAYGFLVNEDYWENNKKGIGFFMPAYYALRQFKDKNGNTKLQEAFDYLSGEREIKKQAATSAPLDEEMMSRPLLPSEMFLTTEGNIFPRATLMDREVEIENKELHKIVGTHGWYEESSVGVQFIPDIDKILTPIFEMNTDSYTSLEGAVVQYEGPPDDIPPNLYTVFYDPVKDEGGGTSLASIICYKGFADNAWEGGMSDTIVAEYIGRFDRVNDIHDICIRMCKHYNAKVLVENNLPDFIRYCRMTSNWNLLLPTPFLAIQKAIKNPGAKYQVGVTMSKQLNIHCEQLLRQWLLEEKALDDSGRVIETNVNNLFSLRAIRELIQYTRDGNFDHVSALKLMALWLAQLRQVPIKKHNKSEKRNRYKELEKNLFSKPRKINNYYAY